MKSIIYCLLYYPNQYWFRRDWLCFCAKAMYYSGVSGWLQQRRYGYKIKAPK